MTHRIMVIGGGTGGTVVSNRLIEELKSGIGDGGVGVMLVSDDTKHVYKPVSLHVPFGVAESSDNVRGLRNPTDERVDIVTNRVRWVDTNEKYLYCRDDNEKLDCDTPALATGMKLGPNAVPGFREGTHYLYNTDGAEWLRDASAGFEGGRLVLSVVGTPHMCPVVPLEFTFVVNDWLRSRGPYEDMDLVYAYPMERSHGKPEVAEWADPILAVQGVHAETDFVVGAVDPGRRAVLAESGVEVDYDLLVGIPPHRGDELTTDSGLDDAGWVDVDQRTFHATVAEDMYVTGSTTALPIPKAGSAAYFQVFTVAERVATGVRGRTPTKHYDGKIARFVEIGPNETSFVSLNYKTPATIRQPSKPVHWAKHAYNGSCWLTAKGML